MENLVAILRVTTAKGGMRFAHVWIKKEGEALQKARAHLEPNETLSAVWTSDWKQTPSKYKLIQGASKGDTNGPNLDVALQLRNQHLKEKGKKPRYRYTAPAPKEPAPPPPPPTPVWHPIVPVLAKAE